MAGPVAGSQRYLDLGHNLASCGTLGLAGEEPGIIHAPLAQLRAEQGQLPEPDTDGLRPEVYRTPGYPALIAAATVPGGDRHTLLLLQLTMSVVTVLLAMDLARVVTGSTAAAVLTGLVLAIHPGDAVFATTIGPETMLSFTLAAALWLTARGLTQGVLLVALGGLALGVAALVKPVAVLALPLAGVYVLAAALPGRKFGMALVLLLCAVLPIAGWMARNQAQGVGLRLSSAGPIHAWCYGVAYMDIAENNGDRRRDWTAAAAERMTILRKQVHEGDDVLGLMTGLSIQEVTQRPATFFRMLGRGVVRYTLAESTGGLYRALGREHKPDGVGEHLLRGQFGAAWSAGPEPVTASVEASWVLWNLMLFGMMLAGAWRMLLQNHGAAAVLMLGLWVVFLLPGAMHDAEAMRAPALAAQAVLAGAAFLVAPVVPRTPVRMAAR